MATNDIVRLTLRGTYAGQEIVNVFHWKQTTSGTLVLEDLDNYLVDTFMSPIQLIISTEVSYTRSVWEQLTAGGIYLDTVHESPIVGTISGDALPPNVCFTFTYLRKVRGNRNGYKRFPGVAETWQNQGTITSGHETALGNVATMLGADITTVGGVTFKPVILHSMLNGQPVVPPVGQEVGSVFFSGLGTQNTRKIGRGS